MSKAVIHHGPLITGPASHLDQKRLALEHPADCIFFPVVNCDLCVYVKKTRTLLSSAYRPGPQSGFAQTLISVICSGWRVSCLRVCVGGVRSGFGDQSPAIPQPVSDLMGLYSDFARLPREEILKGRGWRPMLENLPGLLEHGDTMSWLFPHRARSFPGVLRASSL